MDRRLALEKLSFKELQAEVRKLGLKPSQSRDGCIDLLMNLFEASNQDSSAGHHVTSFPDMNTGLTVQQESSSSSHQVTSLSVPNLNSPEHFIVQSKETPSIPVTLPPPSSNETSKSVQSEPMSHLCTLLSEQMRQQQQMMQLLTSLVTSHSTHQAQSSSSPLASHRSETGGSDHGSSTKISVNTVNLLASQLPEFSGKEDDDIELWILKVERVARIHGASHDMMLLASSSKLVKSARKWFELGTGTINDTWLSFKNALLRQFKRKIPYQVVIKKIEARKWNFPLESFHDYALEKLSLMQSLKLSDNDSIHFLIDGICNAAIRGVAAVVRANTLDEFLEEMHNVTLSFGTFFRRDPHSKTDKTLNSSAVSSPKGNKSEKVQKDAKGNFCAYCRTPGHIKATCFKLKRKELQQSSSSLSPPVAAVDPVASTPSNEKSSEEAPSPVASVSFKDSGRRIDLKDSFIKVNLLNNVPCSFLALIDTGSPVSFISLSACLKINFKTKDLIKSSKNYHSISGDKIHILGSFKTSIYFDSLPLLKGNVTFNVLEKEIIQSEIILGRDFISENNIILYYHPSNETHEKSLILFNEMAFAADLEYDSQENKNSMYSDLKTDFGHDVDLKVINVLNEVDNENVNIVEDDYYVKVALKDNSTYAYAPRRFAWAERLQIREITDDLLARDIIKPSTSPYCARVVPVRKKNGMLRLCVDLRPLNDRVIKQKYPFPLIEDCLARLSEKNVFTLLDLKDGFHHIKVHPEHTKYFSFATPDGQFEYKRLPFGFCEAPAEFQRRIVQILQPLIREDKVIVYIDDILIPSISVDDNLNALRDVLILLKRYSFQLNYSKCLFLRNTLEYLGYILSPSGITMSSRHTEAIKNFPQPTKKVRVCEVSVSFCRKS